MFTLPSNVRSPANIWYLSNVDTTETYTLNITRDSAEYSLRSNKYEIVRFEDNTNEDYVIGINPSTIISDFKNNFSETTLDSIPVTWAKLLSRIALNSNSEVS